MMRAAAWSLLRWPRRRGRGRRPRCGRTWGRSRRLAPTAATGTGRRLRTRARHQCRAPRSHGRNAVVALELLAAAGAGQGEPGDELASEVVGLDDGVDDELGGKVHEVNVGFILGPALGDVRGALVGILDGLDLVVEDRVHGRLWAHN